MSNETVNHEKEVMALTMKLRQAKGARARALQKVARLEKLIKELKQDKRELKSRIRELEHSNAEEWEEQLKELKQEDARLVKQRDDLQERMNMLMRVLP